MGPPVVDFGKVSAASINTQNYFVQNLLSLPIHIVLDVKSIPDFKRTKHTSQVIPPGEPSGNNVVHCIAVVQWFGMWAYRLVSCFAFLLDLVKI